MKRLLAVFSFAAASVLFGFSAYADTIFDWTAAGCPSATRPPLESLPNGTDKAVKSAGGRVFVSHLDTIFSLPADAVAGSGAVPLNKQYWFKWADFAKGAARCGSFTGPVSDDNR